MYAAHVESGRPDVRDDFVPDEGYFERLDEPFGPGSLGLEIGPIRMALLGLSPRQTEALAHRFRPFTVTAANSDLSITLRPARVESFLRARCDGVPETYRLESRHEGDVLHLCSYEFAGRFDTSTGRGVLALTAETGKIFERGLENFLRVLTSYFILERGGLLLHSAGVVRNGRAHLFFGPSGRGKTTVTDLSPSDIVLSDDLSLVVRQGDRFETAGIPFGMAHHRVPDTRATFPIGSLNALVQGPEARREPLTGAIAVAEVLASVPFVNRRPGSSQRVLENVTRLLAAVPAYRLWFRKEPSFWDVVEEAAS